MLRVFKDFSETNLVIGENIRGKEILESMNINDYYFNYETWIAVQKKKAENIEKRNNKKTHR